MCVVNLNVRKQLWPVPVSDWTKLRHLTTVSLSLQFADIKSALGRHIVHGFKRKTEVRQHWLWQILLCLKMNLIYTIYILLHKLLVDMMIVRVDYVKENSDVACIKCLKINLGRHMVTFLLKLNFVTMQHKHRLFYLIA